MTLIDWFFLGVKLSSKESEIIKYINRGRTKDAHVITRIVAKYYGFEIEDLLGRGRIHDLCRARHIAFYLIRANVDISLISVGKIFNRHHATIINGIDKIASSRCRDLKQEILQLQQKIEHGSEIEKEEITALEIDQRA